MSSPSAGAVRVTPLHHLLPAAPGGRAHHMAGGQRAGASVGTENALCRSRIISASHRRNCPHSRGQAKPHDFAQFIAVWSASRLAEELRISSPFSSQSHANREDALRHTCKRLCQLQPTTNCHKLSEYGYLHFWNTTHEYYTTRGNCRSRIWWAGSGRAIGPRPCRGDVNRPAQLPYVPTLALSGCDVFAQRRR